jgi:hypothetical protein
MTSNAHSAGKADFLRRLHDNKGYKRLLPILSVEADRLTRFEKACWLYHREATRHDIKGPRAKSALLHLRRLRCELGAPFWLADSVAESLEHLCVELEKLASRTQRGRPPDPARSFLLNMDIFIPPARDLGSKTKRSISQEEIDDSLSEIFPVVFGRRISKESFTRMRFRYKRS